VGNAVELFDEPVVASVDAALRTRGSRFSRWSVGFLLVIVVHRVSDEVVGLR